MENRSISPFSRRGFGYGRIGERIDDSGVNIMFPKIEKLQGFKTPKVYSSLEKDVSFAHLEPIDPALFERRVIECAKSMSEDRCRSEVLRKDGEGQSKD